MGSSLKRKIYDFLPEDILILIFTYLPLFSIYKLRCVSKVWFSILSNPNFITNWFQFHTINKSLPWIQFHTNRINYCQGRYSFNFRYAYPDSHSQFISRYEEGFSFGFLNLTPVEDDLCLLGSSNGLVLFHSIMSHYVCNPLTREWVSLPSPPQSDQFCVTGFSCEYSSSNISPSSYKVVCIPRFMRPLKKFSVELFSSDLGEWRICQVSCSQAVANLRKCGNVVSHNGVLYWVVGDNKLLAYNLNHNNITDGDHQCRLISMPNEELVGNHILGESEGWICYARIKLRSGRFILSVWVPDEDNWELLHNEVELHDNLAEIVSSIGSAEQMLVLGFNPVDRDAVLLGCKHYIWEFNIRTRRFEELGYPPIFANSSLTDRDKIMMHVQFPLKPMPTILPQPSWDPMKPR